MNNTWLQIKHHLVLIAVYFLLIFLIMDNIKPGVISNYYNIHYHLVVTMVLVIYYFYSEQPKITKKKSSIIYLLLLATLALIYFNFS